MSRDRHPSIDQDLCPEDVLQYLQDARIGAMEVRQFSTAVRAAELMGKHLGMFGKRSENEGPVEVRWAGEDM